MGEWKTKRIAMDSALKQKVVPLLRSQGFSGYYPHFRRTVVDHIETLGFQFSAWGPQFYVEIGTCDLNGVTLLDGTHFPAKSVKHYHCSKRVRIGDIPFDFESADPLSVADRVATAIQAFCHPIEPG